MRRRDPVTDVRWLGAPLVRCALVVVAVGCGSTAPPPVLRGTAPIEPVASVAPAPTRSPPNAPRCPLFPDDCLASDGPRGCPTPATPAITFAPGSATIPRGELAMLDRVVVDSRQFADTARLVITADAARLEPDDLARRRVDAVKDALVARGVVIHAGIVTVTSAVYLLDELPEPPDDRVEIGLRGCRS